MNKGKIFEKDFKASVPSNVLYYRFKDSSGGWGDQSKARFTPKNICDCMIFDGNKLHMLELKTHTGASLPKSCIRDSQLRGLIDISFYSNVSAGFVINMRDFDKTYYVSARDVDDFFTKETRKSIPIKWLEDNGMPIEQHRLKVNCRYNIDEFLGYFNGTNF